MKKFLIFILFTISHTLFANFAFADTSCQPIYGGGQSCIISSSIEIDKKVLNPKTNKFVDNLSINDPKYHPGFILNFKLTITNISNATIDSIDIKDIFPQYVDFNSGPGIFDIKTKTLSFSVNNLKPQESKTFIIMGRIVDMKELSINKGASVCIVNQASATFDKNSYSQDNSQFCIENSEATQVVQEKGGFPILPSSKIKTTPATGPGDFQLIGLAAIGILGYFLRKQSKGL
jgi:hypothetical protein